MARPSRDLNNVGWRGMLSTGTWSLSPMAMALTPRRNVVGMLQADTGCLAACGALHFARTGPRS